MTRDRMRRLTRVSAVLLAIALLSGCAAGSGLLAALLFDAVGTGTSQLNVSGIATDPNGSVIPIQFVPASIVVR